VPVLLQDRCLGILALSTPEPYAYTVTDRDLLLAFARQTAVAIDNARLYREIHRGAERLQVLHKVATLATTGDSLNEMLQRTVRLIKRTIASDNVALLLLEAESGDLIMRSWLGFGGKPKLIRRGSGTGIPGWVVETGKPALVPDVSMDSRYHSCDKDAQSELCVPLRLGSRSIGALNLESRRLNAFSQEDLQLLTTLAEHLAGTIEHARLGEEARDRAALLADQNRHLSLLHEIARVAASTLELATLYQKLADVLAQIIGGDGCYVTHLDEDSNQVLGGAASGAARDPYPHMQPPPGERTLTESVLKAGRPLPIEDVHNSEYISPKIAAMFPGVSQLGLPLQVGERSLGAVLIAFDQPHSFTDDEIARARQAVDLTALALENARLFQSVRQSQMDWETLSLELQDALDNVKTLRGLLPICSSCKKIRDDSGYWQGVDDYVRDHSEARFTHGMCPECLRELYPWFEKGDT
jgi:GAF domain-containing protein